MPQGSDSCCEPIVDGLDDARFRRVLWIVLTMLGGSGILIYLVLWVAMPED